MLFNRHFIWPSFYYNDMFPMVELTKGSSLSVKANDDGELVKYEVSIPEGVDLDTIEATKSEDGKTLTIEMKKLKPETEEEKPKNKVKVK